MKFITKEEMDLLIKKGILRNTNAGLVDKRGNVVGFYRTRNKRYIEDKYANLATKIA